jgi:hypothetical protein
MPRRLAGATTAAIREAHRRVGSRNGIGKLVPAGWK